MMSTKPPLQRPHEIGGGSSIGFMMSQQKQMFVNIEINMFVPKDPYLLTNQFKLTDMIDYNFE
jgi:hypothetical protein